MQTNELSEDVNHMSKLAQLCKKNFNILKIFQRANRNEQKSKGTKSKQLK